MSNDFFKFVAGEKVDGETIEARRQESFEELCVKRLLKAAGYQLGRLSLEKGLANEKYGDSNLDFDWLANEFPEFPARMTSEKLRHTGGENIGWNMIVGDDFKKCPWVEAYKRAAARCDWDVQNEACVLLFNAPKARKASIMTLHNNPGMAHHPEGEYGARLLVGFGRPRIEYVLERLSNLVYTFGTDWVESRCQG